MILPVAKEIIEKSDFCRIPERITYAYAPDSLDARLGADAFASFFDRAVPVEADAFVRFSFDAELEAKPEIYRVRVMERAILVTFRDARGAVNGAATVALLLRKSPLCQCEITDYPSLEYRSIMLDLARGLPKEEDLEYAIKYMALAKYNRLHLHLMDSAGICYASDAVSEFRYCNDGPLYDKAYLRKIDDICHAYAIRVVPEIELPAHAVELCRTHPEFTCDVPNAGTWALCPAADGVLDFFDALIGEVAAIFPHSDYLHIGTDELEFRDLAEPRFCHWDECPRCAALRQREGLADRQAEFYYLVEKIYSIVKKNGKKMMMWSDQIDVAHDVPLSRDILIEFWRIAAPGRGPHEGCTFEKFLEQGFQVVNAYCHYTYFDEAWSMSPEKMQAWTPFTAPEQSGKYAKQIVGAEACAWEYGNYAKYPFYGCVAPAAIALFGDKVWALGERTHDSEFRKAFCEFLFGDESFGEVFDYIGDLLAPREQDCLTFANQQTLSKSAILACAARLRSEKLMPAARRYAAHLEKLAEIALRA